MGRRDGVARRRARKLSQAELETFPLVSQLIIEVRELKQQLERAEARILWCEQQARRIHKITE